MTEEKDSRQHEKEIYNKISRNIEYKNRDFLEQLKSARNLKFYRLPRWWYE